MSLKDESTEYLLQLLEDLRKWRPFKGDIMQSAHMRRRSQQRILIKEILTARGIDKQNAAMRLEE